MKLEKEINGTYKIYSKKNSNPKRFFIFKNGTRSPPYGFSSLFDAEQHIKNILKKEEEDEKKLNDENEKFFTDMRDRAIEKLEKDKKDKKEIKKPKKPTMKNKQ
ncbi:hypothetical protein [Pectobacterium odoriferum]|uniref:hypothetical protein n=1 Tax=Pectobacterium odoriferum TaxID=78398 RepID=UPI000CD0B31F|nr:hypothetical protein [Pectobacterium odoriferum]POE38583.1 hypothetical protein BV920_16495 [Pectobacterium odoriferum]